MAADTRKAGTVGVDQARTEIARGDATAVDVRGEEEWSEGHVPGATHMPDDEGFDAVAVDGGMDDWISEGFNLQPTSDPDEDTELGLS